MGKKSRLSEAQGRPERVARRVRRGPALALWLVECVAEKKTQARNPGFGTSGGEWKGQERDSDLSEVARRFPMSSSTKRRRST